MSKKGYNNSSFVEEVAVEENSVELVSEAVEEEKKNESVEAQEEVKPTPQVKSQFKHKGKVVLITRDGCIVEDIETPGNNRRFYGSEYLTKKPGDIVEF